MVEELMAHAWTVMDTALEHHSTATEVSHFHCDLGGSRALTRALYSRHLDIEHRSPQESREELFDLDVFRTSQVCPHKHGLPA